ncbi:endoribonuclease Dcr-2 [Xylocopa sonorina]|uniref:endoribonuclease Dcr-2 n=1 Tax=Xylocopa sonorina TaxID=1818115 RepID=UPI00403AF3F3
MFTLNITMETDADEFTPRAYQIELFEIALKENAIIYLPTGAGKTFIAVMLIKSLSADIRKCNNGGKHTVFIVNTVPLVAQQSKYIARLTDLSCVGLSGELGIDFWKDEEWNAQLNEHEVFVMTSQILVNALCLGHMVLNKINLIIFDECHRAVNDHPMRQIMRHFENYSKEERPKVLGLTATLLNSNVKLGKIQSIIKSLEITLNARVITTSRALNDYHSTPKEEIIEFNDYIIPNVGNDINNIINEVQTILNSIILNESVKYIESSREFRPDSINKKLASILCDVQDQLLQSGIYAANKSVLLHLIQLECIRKYAINTDSAYILENVITELSKCRRLLEDEMKDNTEMEKIYKYSSDQVKKLFIVLKDFYNNSTDEKFCCIIFVQRRFTAKVLYQILKELSIHDEVYKFLQPDFLTGYSNNPYKNSKEGMCIAKWNSETLHRFRNGLSNCVIATDVLDEGVDIPKCTLVIRYNLATDVRTYIQAKGRARHMISKYVLLVPKSNSLYIKRYQDFQITEQFLKKTLLGKSNDHDVPAEDDIRNELYQHNIPPYIINCNDGQKTYLTELTAISVINKYCSSLLKSKFIYLTPIWVLHKIPLKATSNKEYKVSLKLPIISPLKDVIFGDVQPAIILAKRSAAMKMCIELHKIGELNDKLMPNTIGSLGQNIKYLLPNWIEEDKLDIIGTTKNKRQHQLQFPSALYAAFPLPENTVYLHVLDIKPKYPVPHDDNRRLVFYNLLHSNASFAILSSKQMPEIPSFPLFMNVGELNVNVKANYRKVPLCKEDIGLIKNFHTLIFSEIVPIIKQFMVFDNHNLDNCFLIAPINEKWDINWEVLNNHMCIKRITPSIPFHFKTTDYELALVIPNYRAADTYIVTQICDDITPNSCFPTENFYTYAHYYKEKHGLTINNLNQPMLEVKTISRSIDYTIPRHMQGESKKRRYADLPKNLKEHLVPELCTRIDFPALYWLKATILPSLLHRIFQLLIAEDLRSTIAFETNLGSISINKLSPLVIPEEEREETFEPTSEVSVENIDNLQPEPILNGPEVDVLDTEVYHYPWSKYDEPPNLFRNIEEIQLIQIEHYCQFMSEADYSTIERNNKTYFINKPSISVPPLQTLLLENTIGPNPIQIMYALTTKLGQDVFNLERLETLGDSYLKFITSLFLYNNFPKSSEGALTMLKGKIIGNRHLYYCGVKKNIPGRMKVESFVPLSNFIAPAYSVFRPLQSLLLNAEVSPNVLFEIKIPQSEQFSGCISEITKDLMQEKVLNWETAESQTGMEHYLGMQTVSDKAVADCVEALIGVYLQSMGIKDTIALLKWFQIVPNEIDANSILYGTPENPIMHEGDVNYFIPWASNIETKLGYKFKNRGYLLQAFTHPSFTANNMTECYQRLEFLGDALLDFLITCHIYEYCGNLNPGALTDLRSALVNNITFACLTVRHGLHTALLSYAPELNNIINRFVKFQEDRNHVVDDELLWILLEEEECKMAEHVDVPKVLGDLFESTIGAIYLDSNKNLSLVWEIVYSIMHQEIDKFSKNIPKQPVRVLFETQGARPHFSDATIVDNTNIVMMPLKVTIDGKVKLIYGFGANKKQAKCAAAKQALKNLYKN